MTAPNPTEPLWIGVDVGGTKILSGVFDAARQCLGRYKCTTKAQRGPDVVIERIQRCVRELLDEFELDPQRVRGVGLGVPGAVDVATGCVLFSGNLGWKDVGLKAALEAKWGWPVYVENDCNGCILGIYHAELQCRPRQVIGLFLGTGIGSGLILEGKLYAGASHTAGEIGHTILELDGPLCTCGRRGCFEALASRTALFRQIQEAVRANQPTLLTTWLGADLKDLRSGDLRKAIKKGDRLVADLVLQAARRTGIAAANLINLFNPETLVLGGGLMDALEPEMLPTIEKTAREYAFPGSTRGLTIMATQLGDDAGIMGGVVLAQNGGCV